MYTPRLFTAVLGIIGVQTNLVKIAKAKVIDGPPTCQERQQGCGNMLGIFRKHNVSIYMRFYSNYWT
jgi:hypothetical protein